MVMQTTGQFGDIVADEDYELASNKMYVTL